MPVNPWKNRASSEPAARDLQILLSRVLPTSRVVYQAICTAFLHRGVKNGHIAAERSRGTNRQTGEQMMHCDM